MPESLGVTHYKQKYIKLKIMNKPQSFIDKDRANALLEKWAPVLDYTSDSVKAIDDAHTRLNTAVLLENQEKWCLEESNSAGGGALGGAAQGGVQLNPASQIGSGDDME